MWKTFFTYGPPSTCLNTAVNPCWVPDRPLSQNKYLSTSDRPTWWQSNQKKKKNIKFNEVIDKLACHWHSFPRTCKHCHSTYTAKSHIRCIQLRAHQLFIVKVWKLIPSSAQDCTDHTFKVFPANRCGGTAWIFFMFSRAVRAVDGQDRWLCSTAELLANVQRGQDLGQLLQGLGAINCLQLTFDMSSCHYGSRFNCFQHFSIVRLLQFWEGFGRDQVHQCRRLPKFLFWTTGCSSRGFRLRNNCLPNWIDLLVLQHFVQALSKSHRALDCIIVGRSEQKLRSKCCGFLGSRVHACWQVNDDLFRKVKVNDKETLGQWQLVLKSMTGQWQLLVNNKF